jgi:hypothetical protein
MKRLAKVALLLTFGFGVAAVSHAASSDTLTVTITPNAFYSVDIDTLNVSLDLGTVNLGASTQTIQPATVTVLSTYLTTDLKLQGAITATSNAWSFDDDTTSTDTDKLAAWATFTSVARSSAPTQSADYFSGSQPGVSNSDVIDATAQFVGTANSVNNLFENNSNFDAKDMDAMNPVPAASGTSLLWLYFRLPSATTGTNAQNISITIGATAPQS